jgi:hypothetical protein
MYNPPTLGGDSLFSDHCTHSKMSPPIMPYAWTAMDLDLAALADLVVLGIAESLIDALCKLRSRPVFALLPEHQTEAKIGRK